MIDNNERELYYSLVRHNKSQYFIFISSFIVLLVLVFSITLPAIQKFVIEDYLQGKVYNDGRAVPYTEEDKKILLNTNYYGNWAVDVFIGTSGEARYWIDPIISLSMPIALLCFIITLKLSTILPIQLGFIRQKIEREIINQVDKIHYTKMGYYSDKMNIDLEQEILRADERRLHSIADEYQVNKEEIKYLHKALLWKNSSIIYKLMHPFSGLEFYLHSYFTERYANTMLGLVYIGAAVLIIIIGMRGLKFIPSTQPSMVFFALGLEFSVLITYAVTVMYSKTDSDEDYVNKNNENNNLELKNSKDVENLLRAFLRKTKK